MDNAPYNFYPVWDPLLRVVHWWNAVTVAFQVITGSIILIFGEEIPDALSGNLINMHSVVGYMFAAGLITRILWLFIGPPSASWRDLLPLTAGQRKVLIDTLHYYAQFLKGAPPLYMSHNPFAGLIYAVFFFLASMQVITGVVVLNTPEDLRDESALLAWHATGYILIILYIIAHISAVFIHEFVERHGIIGSMIHGSKTFTGEEWKELTSQNP